MAITADDRYLFTGVRANDIDSFSPEDHPDDENDDVKVFRVSDGRMVKHCRGIFGITVWSMIATPDNKYLFVSGRVNGDPYLRQICLKSQEVVHDYGELMTLLFFICKQQETANT